MRSLILITLLLMASIGHAAYLSIPVSIGGGSIAGLGDVAKVGTPADNQVGVWTGDGSIEGTADLTYDGANLFLTGDIGSTANRITKGWFTGLKVTNPVVADLNGNADTATNGVTASAVIADGIAVCGDGGAKGVKACAELTVNSVTLPSHAHFANADAPYNDTTTPHVLLATEIQNDILTNYGATEDRVYTAPAIPFGVNFMMTVGAAFQISLCPDGTEAFWLNGIEMAAGECIVNAGDTEGEVMSCWSVESADAVYELHCKSSYSNFAEATP